MRGREAWGYVKLWHLISLEAVVTVKTPELARCYLIGSGQPGSSSRHMVKDRGASITALKKTVLTCRGQNGLKRRGFIDMGLSLRTGVLVPGKDTWNQSAQC